MTDQVTNYKCPACTGPLHFVGKSGKLECDYCGSTFEVSEIEAKMAAAEAKAAAAKQEADAKEEAKAADAEDLKKEGWDFTSLEENWGEDGKKMRIYSCPSCGAELICDENTAATSCPYCGNPTIVPGQFSGTLRPDYVIPFKLDKNQAIAALKNHYKGKFFLPRSFTDQNHLEEIRGIYVPFWLFDGTVSADVHFEATRTFAVTDKKNIVTTTEHYNVHRVGTMDFSGIPADASSKMPDEMMDAIEPFDYSEIKPFSTAYMPGFLADKYDVDVEQCAVRADARAKNTAFNMIREEAAAGYQSCTPVSQRITMDRAEPKYAMLPVWMLTTKWRDRVYLFAMNGQTGKFIGDLPVDTKKYWLTFAAIALPLMAVLALFLM